MFNTPIRVAINGFGRIGRSLFRLLNDNSDIQVVAINDLSDARTLSHLLKYDSVHGLFKGEINFDATHIIVDQKKIAFTSYHNPAQCKWDSVDVVVEATGKFKSYSKSKGHLSAGAKRVIVSAPPEDHSIKTIVLGVNDGTITPDDVVISNASCTTNNAAPMIKVVNDLCGIEQAYITTVHSYTTDQSLHDQPHRDLRRARAAGQSIIPTTTGAAKALTRIFPELTTSLGGCGIRVPVPNGSLTDITFNVISETSIETINQAFKQASDTSYKGVLAYTEDPIVSVDILGNTHSCVFDAGMTSVIGKMVKVIGWYDNEIGYSSRLIELIEKIASF
ncbi:type I glyceraldehyde-3-phosphate dehydrogenase [Aquimarina agarivorans]|uniref:type I glyceraldehyde-3-phosphate dehydrogenase n=1 Tax=Aquimarina agarivorans TaxID=980584 RepID=UPI000248FD86|nr:type I glyceraldehyde-3-phosphate dehydrogenase [Aquimarina agarivorans]